MRGIVMLYQRYRSARFLKTSQRAIHPGSDDDVSSQYIGGRSKMRTRDELLYGSENDTDSGSMDICSLRRTHMFAIHAEFVSSTGKGRTTLTERVFLGGMDYDVASTTCRRI